MSIEIINKKPLSEIKEEKEMQKNEIQADIFEVVACLYEEFEGLKSEVIDLRTKVKTIERQ